VALLGEKVHSEMELRCITGFKRMSEMPGAEVF
jgi:hypothetical protein